MLAYHHRHLSISENISECLMTHHHASEDQHWQASYDIAVWLRCTPELTGDLSLELSFQDNGGQHKVLIQRCQDTEKHNHLLSGLCKLNVVGKITHAELSITTSELHLFSFIESTITPSKDRTLSA